jgi:pantoate--beta-alanine ligase
LIVISDISTLRKQLRQWRRRGETICLVPTMGFFHEGHCALMRHGKSVAQRVIVSLFINPTQFGPNEDLSNYPRDLAGDVEKAEKNGVDAIFAPHSDELYRPTHRTRVIVDDLSERYCGRNRPTHFSGVTTIVAKLFNLVLPEFAVFGEKDYQQLVIIKQLVEDLNYQITVIGHPIVREIDGLAMSSRNAYLDETQRQAAPVLFRALTKVAAAAHASENKPVDSGPLLAEARATLEAIEQVSVEYVAIVDPHTLAPSQVAHPNFRVLGAIRVGGAVRLIDNVSLSEHI